MILDGPENYMWGNLEPTIFIFLTQIFSFEMYKKVKMLKNQIDLIK